MSEPAALKEKAYNTPTIRTQRSGSHRQTFIRFRANGVTASFLAVRGRSSFERSCRDRCVLCRQKSTHSLARPFSLSSARVFALLNPERPAPIVTRDLAACCVSLSNRGALEVTARRPCEFVDSSTPRLARRPYPCDDMRSSLCNPCDHILRRGPGSGDCDETWRLSLLLLRRGGAI